MSTYSTNDWRDYEPRNDALAHSWGTSPEQKKEKASIITIIGKEIVRGLWLREDMFEALPD